MTGCDDDDLRTAERRLGEIRWSWIDGAIEDELSMEEFVTEWLPASDRRAPPSS